MKIEIDFDNAPWLNGYTPVAYRVPNDNDYWIDSSYTINIGRSRFSRLIVKKKIKFLKKFPRIVLGFWLVQYSNKYWGISKDEPVMVNGGWEVPGGRIYLNCEQYRQLGFPTEEDIICDDWTQSKIQLTEKHCENT